jgi:molybdopterin/thiamine biosynthesis adenylyltransferase
MDPAGARRIRLADDRFLPVGRAASSPPAVWEAADLAPRHLDDSRPAPTVRAASRVQGRVRSGTQVTLIGCGSVGSYTGLNLAMMNCDVMAIDKDVVEVSNIEAGRTAYAVRTVGIPKVMALVETVKDRGGTAKVLPLPRAVESFSDEEIRALAQQSHVVVAAFDDPEQLRRLNELAYPFCSVVYPGFHAGARSGHVIWTKPGVACFLCSLGIASPRELETLHAEPALPLDIQRISEAAARVALWLVAPPRSEGASLLDPDRNIIFLDNRPSGSAERALSARLLAADPDPSCPVCADIVRHERG